MARSSWTGWISFAGLLMIVIGGLEFIQGLIAVIRSEYYVLTPNQIIIFDMTTWGWLTLLWGIVLVFTGMGLLGGASWARWFAIVAGCFNFFMQLGFVGSSQYTLWSLVTMALTAFVLYALIVRWDDRETV